MFGCDSSSTDVAASTIRVVDGPVNNATVTMVLSDGSTVDIGTTDANGETSLSKEKVENLDLPADSLVTIVSTGGEDENGPVIVDLKLPVLTVSQLLDYINNNTIIHINPTTTFVNYVQTQTNYSLQAVLDIYV